MNRSHLTAVSRKKPSLPVRYLERRGLIQGRVLDYGSGRGGDARYLKAEEYDPYFHPSRPNGKFNTILCSFVLNVIRTKTERDRVLTDIQRLLQKKGRAFFTVRRNIEKGGWTGKGTWQSQIKLDLQSIHRNSNFEIYQMEKS